MIGSLRWAQCERERQLRVLDALREGRFSLRDKNETRATSVVIADIKQRLLELDRVIEKAPALMVYLHHG